MDITQILSWIGTSTGLIIGLPQIYKSIKTRSAKDVSAVTFTLIVITSFCFLLRSITIRETAFILYYFFIMISSIVQLVLIFRYRD